MESYSSTPIYSQLLGFIWVSEKMDIICELDISDTVPKTIGINILGQGYSELSNSCHLEKDIGNSVSYKNELLMQKSDGRFLRHFSFHYCYDSPFPKLFNKLVTYCIKQN